MVLNEQYFENLLLYNVPVEYVNRIDKYLDELVHQDDQRWIKIKIHLR